MKVRVGKVIWKRPLTHVSLFPVHVNTTAFVDPHSSLDQCQQLFMWSI